MSSLKAFRYRYNFSQAQLALLLGIPKSRISMAESNKRMTTDDIISKMTFLYEHAIPAEKLQRDPAQKKAYQKVVDEQDKLSIKALNDHIDICALHIFTLEKKLIIMKDNFDRSMATLALVYTLMDAAEKGNKADKSRLILLRNQEVLSKAVLHRNSQAGIELLYIELDRWYAERSIVEKRLNTYMVKHPGRRSLIDDDTNRRPLSNVGMLKGKKHRRVD